MGPRGGAVTRDLPVSHVPPTRHFLGSLGSERLPLPYRDNPWPMWAVAHTVFCSDPDVRAVLGARLIP